MPIIRFSKLSHVIVILYFSMVSIAHAANPDLTKQLQTILDKAVLHSSTPGAVLLVSSPSMDTVTVAAGYADKKTKVLMQTNSNFRVASISKTFLAVVILRLVDEGKISLDQKLVPLLSNVIDLKRVPNGDKVTVRELLQMRSGIPNYVEYDGYDTIIQNEPNHSWTPQEAVAIIYDEKPTFKPDTSYEYSNTNYVLLQLVVEKITGETLAAQIRKYIFTPLNMEHSYMEIQESQAGGFHGLITHGYELKNKRVTDVTAWSDGFGLGDGAIITTATDLAVFVQALLQSKSLLPINLLNQMLTPRSHDKYGLGIYLEQVNDEWAWTHNGSSSGFSGQYYYFPTSKQTLIMLTNQFDTDIIDDTVSEVMDALAQ
jgi:D-alanyl-D-alanine carboxypeptidase